MDASTFKQSQEANLDIMIRGVDKIKQSNFDTVGYDLGQKDEISMYIGYDPVKAQVNADYFGTIDRSGLADKGNAKTSPDDVKQANMQAVTQAASQAAQAAQLSM